VKVRRLRIEKANFVLQKSKPQVFFFIRADKMCSETTGTNTDRIDMLFAVVQARLDADSAQGRSISIGIDLMTVQIDKVIRDVAILREQQASQENLCLTINGIPEKKDS
jgi:hypothetical protein